MTVSKDGLQYRFVIPGTRAEFKDAAAWGDLMIETASAVDRIL